MPLTPADIHNMAFKKPPIGKRGYDEEDVDAFLDEVEQELIRLLEENQALQEQMMRGGPPPGPAPASMAAMNAELSDAIAQLNHLQEARDRAEQNARGMQAQLERARNSAVAVPRPSDSDERNSPVLMMAQRTADEHMRDARQESEALLAAARTKSEQITSEARLTAGSIEGDARRNHSDAMTSLGAKRAALLEEIDRLGALAQGYQSALESHLAQQLQELDSVKAAPGADL
jgi:DivIVA domain-containing protein